MTFKEYTEELEQEATEEREDTLEEDDFDKEADVTEEEI